MNNTDVTGYIGRTNYGARIFLNVRLAEVKGGQATDHSSTLDGLTRVSFSADGIEYRCREISFCGQIIGDLPLIDRPARGWTLADIARVTELWNEWHLNDLRAGCDHQTVVRDERGIRTADPCPVTGYQYGSSWLVKPVPAEILAEIRAIADKLAHPAGQLVSD